MIYKLQYPSLSWVYDSFAIHTWAKAQFLQVFNCHGLKPVAIDENFKGTLVPNTKLSYTLFG